MNCIDVNNGFLCFAKVDFACPICKKAYSDEDGKYLDRCNKNKSWCARIKCECGNSFHMIYDYKGDAVSFLIRASK